MDYDAAVIDAGVDFSLVQRVRRNDQKIPRLKLEMLAPEKETGISFQE